MKKFEDRQVRVFISSTFRGMGEEREVLVRHVFPEIHLQSEGLDLPKLTYAGELPQKKSTKA